jgi:Tol biopolymer transport system component
MRKIIPLLLIVACLQTLSAAGFGKNKIQKEPLKWSVLKTMHFDIYFEKGNEEFGQMAALMTEEAYYYLKNEFKQPITYRFPVIFYSTHTDFEATNIIYPLLSEGVGGFTEYTKNRVVVPFDGSYFKLEAVLIHELTHAYVKSLDHKFTGSAIINSRGRNLPFWLAEGLPEFLSVGGTDNYNNMFIVDMLVNDYLYPMDQLGGYFAYREGEAFLTYISDVYGREKVMTLVQSIRHNSDIQKAFEKVLGHDFKTAQKMWKNYLKRKYAYLYNEYDIPYEVYKRKTDHIEQNSNMNYSPAFSPDGQHYLYYSNRDMRTSIWLGSTHDTSKDKKIIVGQRDGRFEDFHFQRNNISWFPDNDRFAFAAKMSFGDVIYIYSLKEGKIVNKIEPGNFEGVYEVSVSPDGKKIAFTAESMLQTDLYIYDLEKEETTQLTDDAYNDAQPAWSPDGNEIAFSSERTINDSLRDHHNFYALSSDIFTINPVSGKVMQITHDFSSNQWPMWTKDSKQIIFVSDENHINNLDIVKIETGERADFTKCLSGIFNAAITQDNKGVLLSIYYESGWNLYLDEKPFDELNYFQSFVPVEYQLVDDFASNFPSDDYKLYGNTDREFKKITPRFKDKKGKTIDFAHFAKQDSLAREHNRRIDEQPTEISEVPRITNYKPKFSLDNLWGGMAYSSSRGTVGQLQMSMSDLMGNHAIGTMFGIAGDWEESSIVVNYLYLANRIDYGVGVFHVSQENYWRRYLNGEFEGYYLEVEREFGFYALTSYPLSKFFRVDLDHTIYGKTEKWSKWDGDEYVHVESLDDNWTVYAPRLSFVYDNALYGPTGPLDGKRCMYSVSQSAFSDLEYITHYTDLRFYRYFAKRFSFAFRLAAGASFGPDAQNFELNRFFDVRAYEMPDAHPDYHRKAVSTMELRFPLLDYMKLGFPLPIELGSIRGSAYLDVGAVWNDDDFKGYEDDRLKDLKMGFGFGPRFNLGFVILKVDFTWESDLVDTSKPSIFISLLEDF